MTEDDVIPYRIASIVRRVAEIEQFEWCDTTRQSSARADPQHVGDGLLAAGAALLVYALLLMSTLSMAIMGLPEGGWITVLIVALAGLLLFTVVYTVVAYETPIVCMVPVPQMPLNLVADVQVWFSPPTCMCALFPTLVRDVECGAQCMDETYIFDSCASGVPGFGFIWSVEYFVEHTWRGLIGGDSYVEFGPAHRTEHSCWLLFASATLPLMVLVGQVLLALMWAHIASVLSALTRFAMHGPQRILAVVFIGNLLTWGVVAISVHLSQ
jgi:hypothetical protein